MPSFKRVFLNAQKRPFPLLPERAACANHGAFPVDKSSNTGMIQIFFCFFLHFRFVQLLRKSFQPVGLRPHNDAVPSGQPQNSDRRRHDENKNDGFDHDRLLDDKVLVVLFVVSLTGNGADASAAGQNVQPRFLRQAQNDEDRNDRKNKKQRFPHVSPP